jgi:IclR family transcriptional regulator, acetate operon repressor
MRNAKHLDCAASDGDQGLAQPDDARKRPGGVQAVDRACRLLTEVIRTAEPLSVGELSRRTGLHQSTTSRLLASLQRHGLVERDTARGRVRIAAALVGQITSRSVRQALLDAARPVLENIGRTTSETVNLSVPVAGKLVDNIAQVDAPHILATTNWVGRFIPLHCSSPGKVFLAYGVADLPHGPLARFTPQTITDRRALEAELKLVRRRGFATLMDELEPGLRAVAVPVVDGHNEVIAAVAVSGPSARLPKRRIRECAEVLAQASVALTARFVSAWPQPGTAEPAARGGTCVDGPC